MIKDKQKMGTLLDEIDEEITERNLTEDAIRASEAIAPTETEGENPQTDIFENNR